MSGWFGQSKKRSPRLGLVGSGNIERSRPNVTSVLRSSDVRLEGDGGHDPLAWDKMPSVLQEKFPHWKDSSLTMKTTSHSSDSEVDSSYSCYKSSYSNKQQPDYTFPYVVMDNDTLNSIAVKFETTPTELARLNKKLVGLSSAIIFTGEVLYVPDHDELARSAPKSAPPTLHSVSDNNLSSSLDSQGTLRSSSVSQPPSSVLGDDDDGVNPPTGTPPPPPHVTISPPNVESSEDLLEEVTDTHIVLISRYISDDQGCIHGNLMINQTVLIFTPFRDNPLVKEHGPAGFEIMIPLQDIIFAAFARDVEQPQMKRLSKETQLLFMEKKGEMDSLIQGVVSKGVVSKEEEEDKGSDKVHERIVKEEKKEGEVTTLRDGEGDKCMEDDKDKGMEDDKDEERERPNIGTQGFDDNAQEKGLRDSFNLELDRDDDGPPHYNHYHHHHSSQNHSSTDELLAIMGGDPLADHVRRGSSHTNSECSADSGLSDHLCFLHLTISHKSCASHTYMPINRSTGIDIPSNKSFSPAKGTLQQVKTLFCFAVAEHRVLQLANFISQHHPNPGHGSCWKDGIYEFISHEESLTNEDLVFSDNHFQGADSMESWEVYSLKDESKYRPKIDRMEIEGFLPLPVLSESSNLMEDSHLRALSNNLPSAAVGHDWILIYSTFKHGISLRTLYRNMVVCELPETPVVLLIRDDQYKLFGAAITSPLRLSEKFYGTGESYLFSFESPTNLKIYNWTGENDYIVKGSSDGLFVGCGDGHTGLWLDEYLLNGTSEYCSTFENDCLSSKAEFICTGVEAWGFL